MNPFYSPMSLTSSSQFLTLLGLTLIQMLETDFHIYIVSPKLDFENQAGISSCLSDIFMWIAGRCSKLKKSLPFHLSHFLFFLILLLTLPSSLFPRPRIFCPVSNFSSSFHPKYDGGPVSPAMAFPLTWPLYFFTPSSSPEYSGRNILSVSSLLLQFTLYTT